MSQTTTTAQAVNEWCAQVRDLHAEHARPIHGEDARLELLCEAAPASWTPITLATAGFDADELGELYFTRATALPEFPAITPSWAIRTQIRTGSYPEIVIERYGRDQTMGTFTARIVQCEAVNVETAGHTTGPATIEVSDIGSELTLEQAMNLSIALEGAAHELAGEVAE